MSSGDDVLAEQVESKGAPDLAMETTEQVPMIVLDAVTPVEEPQRRSSCYHLREVLRADDLRRSDSPGGLVQSQGAGGPGKIVPTSGSKRVAWDCAGAEAEQLR